MGKVITGIGNAVGKVVGGAGKVLGGLLAPKMDTPAPAPAPEAVTPAPAAPPAATPTQAGPSDVVSEGARRLIGKGKKSVTVSRTSGGGVGLNV